MLKKILKNITLLLQGRLGFREALEKVFNYCLDNSRLFRKARRLIFSRCINVSFRPIELSDEKGYFFFLNRYFKNNPLEQNRKRNFPKNSTDNLSLIALHRDNIIGVINLRKVALRGSRGWQISGIAILREFRSKGIGQRLLKKAVSTIKNDGNLVVFLDVLRNNLPAINLYKKAGFRVPFNQEDYEVDNIRYPPQKVVMVLRD